MRKGTVSRMREICADGTYVPNNLPKYKTHKYSVGRKYNYWMINLLVHHVKRLMIKLSLSTPWSHTGVSEVYLHSFLTLELDGDEWSSSRPGCFDPVKQNRSSLTRKLGGPQSRAERCGDKKNILILSEFEPRTQ